MNHSYKLFTLLALIATITNAKQRSPKLICLNKQRGTPATVFLFAHGIDPRSKTCKQQAQAYIDNNIITGPCYTFDFKDGLKTVNFGQQDDCNLLKDAYQKVIKKHKDTTIILVGISRGAVAILNTFATHPTIDWSPVKAVILESPYANVGDMAEQIASSYLFFIPFKKKLMRKLINILPNYNPEGMQTLTLIEHIKTTIPLFIGYSQADKTVPPEGTRCLIAALRADGHAVTSWPTPRGHHSTLACNAGFAQAARTFLGQYT